MRKRLKKKLEKLGRLKPVGTNKVKAEKIRQEEIAYRKLVDKFFHHRGED